MNKYMNIDDKKITKNFIVDTGKVIKYWYETHHNQVIELKAHDKIAYLIADKGIEKRIEKQIFKVLGLKSEVKYLLVQKNNNLQGHIKVKLLL